LSDRLNEDLFPASGIGCFTLDPAGWFSLEKKLQEPGKTARCSASCTASRGMQRVVAQAYNSMVAVVVHIREKRTERGEFFPLDIREGHALLFQPVVHSDLLRASEPSGVINRYKNNSRDMRVIGARDPNVSGSICMNSGPGFRKTPRFF